ncbi:MAG TPA: Rieske (2Fe-2S) protein [Solirubrobacterales bacterium]|nr:Rieske (2Fe-2S) protein [Solirubrobacterales bacterium]
MRKGFVSPAMALLPLRLFLGLTFVYAGIQKLSDPGFLHAGAPTYIGSQLEGFAAGTPAGFVLKAFAIPVPVEAGIGVALAEITIGLLAASGLYTRAAAAGGLGLNFLLFLTASWHTTPYFLGPDIVFSFAWLPFVLAGAEGQPALDNLVDRPAVAQRTRLRPFDLEEGDAVALDPGSTRRTLLLELGAAAAAIAGISLLAKGAYSAPRSLAQGPPSAPGGGEAGQAGSGRGASKVPANAVELGPARRLPSGSAATYSDPADGAPDIVIRDSEGDIRAFSAVCTHAGCTVGYEGGTIVCPCHGGEYSAETGAVIAGPPPAPLEPRRVLEANGKIYALPT